MRQNCGFGVSRPIIVNVIFCRLRCSDNFNTACSLATTTSFHRCHQSFSATAGYNYSVFGIPLGPQLRPQLYLGLRLDATWHPDAAEAIAARPRPLFRNYTVTFDADQLNWPFPMAAGSTNFLTAGTGSDGSRQLS